MITIRNTNTGATMTVKTPAKAKEVLRQIVKSWGRQALKGVYIDHPKGGTFYAEDMELSK